MVSQARSSTLAYHLIPGADPDTKDEDEMDLDHSLTAKSRTRSSDLLRNMPSELRNSATAARIAKRATSYGIIRAQTGLLEELEEKTRFQILGEYLESTVFQGFIALLILLNSVVIGLETDYENLYTWDILENAFLVVFFAELVLKILAFGPSKIYSLSDPDFTWNFFDAIIVCAGVFDAVLGLLAGTDSGGIATLFRILRLLRIMRIFRIVRFLKQLYLLVLGFTAAAKAVGWVSVLMVFLLYVCSIVLVRTVGTSDSMHPSDHYLREKFSTIGISMFTLFELMASPSIQEYHAQEGLLASHPIFTAFLIGWVIFGSFGMIALLTGVISESMFAKNQIRLEEERLERENLHKFLEEWCKDEFDCLDVNDLGEASIEDIARLLPKVRSMCEFLGVDFSEREVSSLHEIMDTDDSGNISCPEFCRAVLSIVEGSRPVSFQEIRHCVSVANAKLNTNTAIMKRMLQLLEETRPATTQFASQLKRQRSKLNAENGSSSVISFGARERNEPALGSLVELDQLLLSILERMDKVADMQSQQFVSVDAVQGHSCAVDNGTPPSRWVDRHVFGTAEFGRLSETFGEEVKAKPQVTQEEEDKDVDFAEMSAKLDNACRKLEEFGHQLQSESELEPVVAIRSNAAVAIAEGESRSQSTVTSAPDRLIRKCPIDELVASRDWAEVSALMLQERDQIRQFVDQIASVLDGSHSQSLAPVQEHMKQHVALPHLALLEPSGAADDLAVSMEDLMQPPDIPSDLPSISQADDYVQPILPGIRQSSGVPQEFSFAEKGPDLQTAARDLNIRKSELPIRQSFGVPHEFSFADKGPDLQIAARDLSIHKSELLGQQSSKVPHEFSFADKGLDLQTASRDLSIHKSELLGLHFDSDAWAAVSPLGSRNLSVETETTKQ